MEQSLFEMAGQLRREVAESFLCGTRSQDSSWLPLWRDRVEHLYDLRRLLAPEALGAFAVSFARNWRPDLLLIHGIGELHPLLGPIRNELPRAKLGVVYRGSEAERDLFSGEPEWLAAVDHHFVATEASAKWLYEMTVAEENISVIRPGVDCERFEPGAADPKAWRDRLDIDRKKRIILFAGRLVDANRPLLVLDIAARLGELRSTKGFHFVIAGEGPLQESLRSKITARDLGANVSLAGHVPDMRDLLGAAALTILPAAGRDLPQIVLESLAMEVPVVARRGDAVASILGGDVLELVGEDEEDHAGFARAIDALLGDATRRSELGAAGRKLVQSEYPIDNTRTAWREWLAGVTG